MTVPARSDRAGGVVGHQRHRVRPAAGLDL